MSGNRVYIVLFLIIAVLSSCILYAPPEIVEPLENHPVASSSPEISWLEVEKAVGYQYQWNKTGDFSDDDQGGLVDKKTDIQLKDLGDGTYFFRVRALFPKGKKGRWSKTRRFSVKSVIPSISVPAEGKQFHLDEDFLLTWKSLDKAEYYELQISSARDFQNIIHSASQVTGSGEIRYTVPGQSDGEYYIRIRAVMAGGNVTDWSSARHITVQPGFPFCMNEDTPYNKGLWNAAFVLMNGEGKAAVANPQDGFYSIDSQLTHENSLISVGYIATQEEYSLWDSEEHTAVAAACSFSPEGKLLWRREYKDISWFRMLEAGDEGSVLVLVRDESAGQPRILRILNNGDTEVVSRLDIPGDGENGLLRTPLYSLSGSQGQYWAGEGSSLEDKIISTPADPRAMDNHYLDWGFFPATRFGWAAATDLFGGTLWSRDFSDIHGFIPSFLHEKEGRLWLAGSIELPGKEKRLAVLELNPQSGETLSKNEYELDEGFGTVKSLVMDERIILVHYNSLFVFSGDMEYQETLTVDSPLLKKAPFSSEYSLYITDIYSHLDESVYLKGVLYHYNQIVTRWVASLESDLKSSQWLFHGNQGDGEPYDGFTLGINSKKK